MKKFLLSIIFLFGSNIQTAEPNNFPSLLELSDPSPSISKEKIRTIFHRISDGAIYFGAGTALGSASLLAGVGWTISLNTPWDSTVGNECFLLSRLCASAASHAFSQMFKGSPSTSKRIPLSQSSWYLNRMLLSQIPAFSNKEKRLLHFLENRWLAKSTGFFPSIIDWVSPCFGVSIQVNPETANTYARDPWNGFSETYKNRVAVWKRLLPHPQSFPLILTRPFDLQGFLPSGLDVPQYEEIRTTVEKVALKMQSVDAKVVVDLTHVLPEDSEDSEKWFHLWNDYQTQFSRDCKRLNVNLNRILCVQRVQREEIGGIRLLPFADQPAKVIEHNHRFLLEWVAIFGLTANRIELDRFTPVSDISGVEQDTSFISIGSPSKEEFVSFLNSFKQNWKSNHPQKTLMLDGTLQILKGLLGAISKDKWNEIMDCPTRSAIMQLSFLKIKEQFNFLAREKEEVSFFDTVSHLEQIHADLSSLIEIFDPYIFSDFTSIYLSLLSIPEELKPLTSCAVHSSGMTSMGGIFKAVEKTLGAPPRVLYGENTYYEGIKIANHLSEASSIDEATEEDWKQVDLILAQFNPALKRIELPPTVYKVEKVAEVLQKALNARQGKPLTLALDCTIDFIDSPRAGLLFDAFQKEIEAGILNIICYRSGLKYDLFGMDNYSGAPLYMIHSRDPKWASFDSLLTDPVLQTDTLSLNWFCLAYQNAAPLLELYRKQIFDNTRAFLSKVPLRLFNENSKYRIVPFDQESDLAFVDIKISGPLHQIRGAALAGGSLYLGCMEGGHPIFYRPSLGFYHPNFTMLFDKKKTTIRLTVGLDPTQVDLLTEIFERIDMLNP